MENGRSDRQYLQNLKSSEEKLLLATKFLNFHYVKSLLHREGKSINVNYVDALSGYTSLHYAVSQNSIEFVHLIETSDSNVDINFNACNGHKGRGDTPLHITERKGYK